jgi:RNA polymerase sigma factor (sigma-70 family)
MSSDERLVRRATQGDTRAFEAIYRRYHQDLYRFCLAMVGDPQDAQDTLQNTMVKVLRALPGEQREIHLKPWLYRIARNESVETLRRRRDSAELEPHQAVTGGIAETVETRERLRTLLTDLEQLPERQRTALVMRELSGLDFDQIGAAFETSPAVARQTLYEARLSLRQLEAGREMRCAEVMMELSNADGRVARRREIRAHLRGCADCRAFRDDMAKRREDLAALTPLPLAASAALLHDVLGKAAATSGAAASGSGLAGGIGAGAGKVAATSAIVKSAATVAVVAVVGISAADRGGLVDLPLPDRNAPTTTQGTAEPIHPPDTDGSAGRATSAVSPAADADTGQLPGGDDAGDRGEKGQQEKSAAGPGGPDDAAADAGRGSSPSQAGLDPPGGGHGRSASERRGRPETLPDAAGQGQQTAAANKAPQAASPPGRRKQSGERGPAAQPAQPPKAKPPAAAPDPPPSADAQVPPDKPGHGHVEATTAPATAPQGKHSKEAG